MAKFGCLAWNRTRTSGVRDRHAADYATRQMVAREGSAPPISGCRPDVILFHHRAEKIGNNIGNLLANHVAYINDILINVRCLCSIRLVIISA
jgi:hypothetical protein